MINYKKLVGRENGNDSTINNQHYPKYKRSYGTKLEPDTMDNIYLDIQNPKRVRHLNYKERMGKNMQKSMYLMEDLHRQLSEYWQDFGFLSKSSSESFAKAILPTIRVYHHHNIDQTNEEEIDDEDL